MMTTETLLLYAVYFNAAQIPCVSDIIQDGPCVRVGSLGFPGRGSWGMVAEGSDCALRTG